MVGSSGRTPRRWTEETRASRVGCRGEEKGALALSEVGGDECVPALRRLSTPFRYSYGNRIPQIQSKNTASIPSPAGNRVETNRFPAFRPARHRIGIMKRFPEKENLFRTRKLFVYEWISSRLNHILPHCLHENNNISSSLCQWAGFLFCDAYDLIEKCLRYQ